ncbi:MAG: excinuclease ABC subunit UvrA [Pirellulaceae bacterium]
MKHEIQVRGVTVHNLKSVDLDIPHRQLVVFCGVSGSGKTSLALDTLYAEGQRRYIESFSAYTRQFLDRMDKPAADRIDGIPPSIAVTHKNPKHSGRSTVGTATETTEYLRLLFAKIGETYCYQCGAAIHRDTPESAANKLDQLPEGVRFLLAFQPEIAEGETATETAAILQEDGFVRAILDGQTITFADTSLEDKSLNQNFWVVVDRLTSPAGEARIRDSLETAFRHGLGRCAAFLIDSDSFEADLTWLAGSMPETIDGRTASKVIFGTELRCDACNVSLPKLEPRLFSSSSPLGACPECEGFGNLVDIDMNLVVPDPKKSLKEGAVAPWNTPAYKHELHELLALAGDYNLPVDIPYRELTDAHKQLVYDGVPERNFGGLRGFFAWLEKRKYKMHLRVYLSRWRSATQCPSCNGTGLRKETLGVRIGGKNMAEIHAMRIVDAEDFFASLNLTAWQSAVGNLMTQQVRSRLKYLNTVGLGYLTLDRPLKTLSGGEAQRVSLTSAMGSALVNMLYVLDEPSVGLHPCDSDRLVATIQALRDRGNSVVVVEHDEAFLNSADQIVEVGPAAGEHGGEIIFQGSPQEMRQSDASLTGEYLAGRRGLVMPSSRRSTTHGWVKIVGARGNNLKNITAEFPLGTLCVVTGVSGAGKSTLIEDTLYPALCIRKRKDAGKPLPYDDVMGAGQIDDVILVDQSPIGKSPRSNPVTYIKAFDAIRNVFADTLEARTHNYSAGHFSFNVDGGRCTNCSGDGFVQIDMQFLADVYMKCSQCQGKRYRKEILDVTYRGKNIADVLEMSIRQAFLFFRGQEKVQTRLKQLMDVGLDYLRLGQPANTLSAGEAQRLKLAGYLATAKRKRTLFLLDEPTTGLHFSDIVKLIDCFETLLSVGHSLIIVEHNSQVMKAADYIVDIGPGAAEDGGQIVAAGTPEQVAESTTSITAKYLKEALANSQAEE